MIRHYSLLVSDISKWTTKVVFKEIILKIRFKRVQFSETDLLDSSDLALCQSQEKVAQAFEVRISVYIFKHLIFSENKTTNLSNE